MESTAEVPVQIENKPKVNDDFIQVGKDNVRVSWVKFADNQENRELPSSNEAVIFLMGYPWQAKSETLWTFPQDLAKQFKVPSYNIETDLGRIDPNGLSIEAEATRQFIEKQKLNKVTLIGHSEGGIRAADLATLLEQKNPQVQINGVVLMNPMGMYPELIRTLGKNFFVEVAKIEGQEKNPAVKESMLRIMLDFAKSIGKDIKSAWGIKYPWLVANQMGMMTRLNQSLAAIKAPVVVMSTERDFVSDYRKYLPQEGVSNRMEAKKTDEQLKQEVESRWEKLPEKTKARYDNKENFVQYHMGKFKDDQYTRQFRKREEVARVGQARQQFLRETRLSKADNLAVVIAKRYGSHVGLPAQRSEQTAHVVSRIFDRLKRSA